MSEYYAGLDVIQKIFSDPIWRERSKMVKNKDELIRFLLEFCSEKGEIIKVDKKKILLFAERQP